MIIIREATSQDAQTIYNFIISLAKYEKTSDSVITSPGLIKGQLSQKYPPFKCLIAELNGNSIGFALFFFNYSTWLGKQGIYLEDIYVVPEYRKAGVGNMLFSELIKIAKNHNCGRIEWMVLDWNDLAISFYKKIGAKPVNGWEKWRIEEEGFVL